MLPSAVAFAIALTVFATAAAGRSAPKDRPGSAAIGTSQLLVKFKESASADAQANALAAAGAKQVGDVRDLGVKVVTVPTAAATAVLARFRNDSGVSFAEPDSVLVPQDNLPNDPSFPTNYAVAGGAWGWTMTHTTQAWDVTKGDPSVVVAILDTGIKTSGLSDLNGQISSTYNAMNGSTDVTTNAGNHGTYVAGIAGLALGNGAGNAGFCPGCKLMIVQVGTDSGATLSAIANGLTWAADHGARVANMSWAGTSDSPTLASATTYAHNHGVVMTAAAGNSNCNCVTYPSADPYVIGVAGVDNSGNKAGDSNYGSWVKVAAPEGNMTAWPTLNGAPGYAAVGGTSSAAPAVAGIVGLLFSADSSLTGAQVEQALESSAVPVGFSVQYGRVDALAALGALGFADPQLTSLPINTTVPQLLLETNGDFNYQLLGGAPQVGQVLLRGQGGWTGSAPLSIGTVQWQRCNAAGTACSVVATAAKYTVQSTDTGYSLRFVVTVKNGVGSVSLASPLSAPVGGTMIVSPPSSTSPPMVSGSVQAGQTLVASTGVWSGSPTSYAYQWSRCDTSGVSCAAIVAAAGASYTVQAADVGATLEVSVTAANSGGSATATSAVTAVVTSAPSPPSNTSPPTISGTAQDGQTLTVSTGSWSGSPTSYAYTWSRCDTSGANCTVVSGATASSYAAQTVDVGATLEVAVTATNNAGTASATSAATGVVASAPAPPPSGPTTQNVIFSGSLNSRSPSRTFTITVGAGLADAQLSFSKCSALTLGLSNGNAKNGPSIVVLDSTLSAGTYAYTVSGGRCSFTLNVTAPSP
jgi:thermitase